MNARVADNSGALSPPWHHVSSEALAFLRTALAKASGDGYTATTIPLRGADFRRVMETEHSVQWTFWATPSGEETLGWGSAFTALPSNQGRFPEAIAATARIAENINQLTFGGNSGTVPRFFSAFAFDPVAPMDGDWAGIPANCCVLPRVTITRSPEACTATVIIGPGFDPGTRDACLALLNLVGPERVPRTPRSVPRNSAFAVQGANDGFSPWERLVASIRAGIERGELEKIVLARSVDFTLPSAPNLADALATLTQYCPETYRTASCFGNTTFLAATPELLVAKKGLHFETQALAGSVSLAENGKDRRAAERKLAGSKKDSREHAFVVEAIRRKIGAFSASLEVPDKPRVHAYRDIAHLETPVEGVLARDTHVLHLVDALHPTPAVGGVPADAALRWIRDNEGNRRGWYAGPVGWFDLEGNGCFVTAIRSALLRDGWARLFAGAGIVAESDAKAEFLETEAKLTPMKLALGTVR